MKKALLAAGIVALAACADTTSPTSFVAEALKPKAAFLPGNNRVIVSPGNTDGWFFFNDENDAIDASLGSFVSGPGTPVDGTGSAQISVTGTERRNLATYQFAGVPLANITTLSFRTYNPSFGNGGSATRSAYLHFNVDFSGVDNWQRRLVFVPNQNGTVLQDTWQQWDAINSGNAMWAYSGGTWPAPGTTVSGLKSWTQILSEYPGVRIRISDPFVGLRVGEPYADGYTENIDSFTFGTAAGTTVYDFEGNATFGSCAASDDGTTITLLANCVTDRTLIVPNGYTLNGNGKTITAVNPASGNFVGAVVRNGGPSANVTGVTILTGGDLTGCYESAGDRLRGIMLDGASGSITNNTVRNIRRTGNSGCQEGNAIEARNAPFDKTGSDLLVTISGNVVSDYQKTGILANGSVSALITGNQSTGLGAITYIAQNGIQVGFGATATVKDNTMRANNYTPADTESCGLLLYLADGVKASGNKYLANEVNQCNAGKGGGKVTASN